MFQLRGLGDPDCSTNPSDPVCQAFYGTTPTASWGMVGTVNPTVLQNEITKAIANGTLKPSAPAAPQNAGVNVATQTVIPTAIPGLTTSVGLWDSIPWWLKLAGIVGLGWVGYTQWYAPTSKKAG